MADINQQIKISTTAIPNSCSQKNISEIRCQL